MVLRLAFQFVAAGSVYTDETTNCNNSAPNNVPFFTAAPAAGDAFYFGSYSIFNKITRTVDTAGDLAATYAWEYWNGAGWISVNVSESHPLFTQAGTAASTFEAPTNWTPNNVNGSILYWLRLRLIANISQTTQALGSAVILVNEYHTHSASQTHTHNNVDATGINMEDATGSFLNFDTTTHFTSFITPGFTSVPTKINIPVFGLPAYAQILAMGLSSGSDATARGILFADARTVTHQPTVGILDPVETEIGGLSWDGSSTIFNVKSSQQVQLLSGTIALNVGGSPGSKVTVGTNNVFFPVQAANASPPAYVAGGMYYDTTLNKLRIGGAAGWETVTSV
jgi:hypothetical protein